MKHPALLLAAITFIIVFIGALVISGNFGSAIGIAIFCAIGAIACFFDDGVGSNMTRYNTDYATSKIITELEKLNENKERK